ncbi:membrane protein [Stenotrophomonas maltophilia]|nr:membrane protein [Stenotrophomonas maltophilia]
MPTRRQWLMNLARPRQPETLPQRLDRRRIYVLPTRFGLFVAAVLAAMLLGALNYNNNPALLLALLLAGAGVASAISAHLTLSGLSLDAVSAEPVAAGQPLRVHVALSQREQRGRPGLQLDHGDAHSSTAVPAGGRVDAELELPTTQRGWLDLDRIRLSTTQPLGLVRAWSWFWPDQPLLVYPHAETQGPGLPEQGSDPLHSRMDAAGEELHQLRPYRAGDPRRSIAWKHSARRDTLLVREYEKPAGIEVMLDWRQLHGLGTEQRIARLARWVDLAEREGRRYTLKLPGQPALGPAQGASHHHLCLRALALLPHD